jgi:hypothetical protein
MGTILTIFFIVIGILLVLFIAWSINYDKNHDKHGHTICRECGCTPDITLYTENIWGEKHYCVKCAEKVDGKKFIDYHYNTTDDTELI